MWRHGPCSLPSYILSEWLQCIRFLFVLSCLHVTRCIGTSVNARTSVNHCCAPTSSLASFLPSTPLPPRRAQQPPIAGSHAQPQSFTHPHIQPLTHQLTLAFPASLSLSLQASNVTNVISFPSFCLRTSTIYIYICSLQCLALSFTGVTFALELLLSWSVAYVATRNLRKRIVLRRRKIAHFYIWHGTFIFDAISTLVFIIQVPLLVHDLHSATVPACNMQPGCLHRALCLCNAQRDAQFAWHFHGKHSSHR